MYICVPWLCLRALLLVLPSSLRTNDENDACVYAYICVYTCIIMRHIYVCTLISCIHIHTHKSQKVFPQKSSVYSQKSHVYSKKSPIIRVMNMCVPWCCIQYTCMALIYVYIHVYCICIYLYMICVYLCIVCVLSCYRCSPVCACTTHAYMQCVAVCCSVLQCVAVCCSVLECVAVRTTNAYMHTHHMHMYIYLYVCVPIYVCICIYMYIYTCVYISIRVRTCIFTHACAYLHAYNTYMYASLATGWRRFIAYLKLHVSFRKRATHCRALLQKMTYKDKACYASWPPCIVRVLWCFRCSIVCACTMQIYIWGGFCL